MALALYQREDDDVAFTDEDHARIARRMSNVETTLGEVVKGQAVSNALLQNAVTERRETAEHVKEIAGALNRHLGAHDADKPHESSGWVRIGLALVELLKAQPILTLAIIGLLATLGGTGLAELLKHAITALM